ncbi:MAG: hypothetical protein ACLFRG_12960, partial [Desulfococcaceae bacterium]
MAEFLLIRNSRKGLAAVWVVEAKSSTPRPETRPGFDDFIAEIREKLTKGAFQKFRSFLSGAVAGRP